MKSVISYFITLLLLYSCNSKETKHLSNLESLIAVTDSLLAEVENKQDETLVKFYKLTEDSLNIESLSASVNLSDTLGFYEYLENDMKELSEFMNQTKREINFIHSQLTSVKTEYLENKINEEEFNTEISELERMIGFLKERVDTNMMIVNERYRPLFNLLSDTAQNEKSE